MNRRAAALVLCLLPLAVGAPWVYAAAANTVTVVQARRAFSMAEIHIKRGDTINFTNDDAFNHQVFVKSPAFSFESAEQVPGKTITVAFPAAGLFDVQCEIHPRMHLAVTVE